MVTDITQGELSGRLDRFRAKMNEMHPDWDCAFIVDKVNQYYFTGTMQDGLLVIKKSGEACYFVYRSFERAKDESPFPNIYAMKSYREAAALAGAECGNTFIEVEIVTVGLLERLKKYFHMAGIHSLDRAVFAVRAVKSPYELQWMERAGRDHLAFMENDVPAMMKEGISEADFTAMLFEKMVERGGQGINRFSMFQTEMIVGQVGFGESSIYPTSFDGAGGAYGLCPAVPLLGSRERKLKKGDLVFVDAGFGENGYHSDKTQVYSFGGKPADEVVQIHRACIAAEEQLAAMLKPGAVPAEIYQVVMGGLSEEFKRDFMGFGGRQAKFLGHGIGLHVDEFPVIASGSTVPLAENMAIAVEPKKGIAGVGMVGVEDTYIVTPNGGRCITGGGRDIIIV